MTSFITNGLMRSLSLFVRLLISSQKSHGRKVQRKLSKIDKIQGKIQRHQDSAATIGKVVAGLGAAGLGGSAAAAFAAPVVEEFTEAVTEAIPSFPMFTEDGE